MMKFILLALLVVAGCVTEDDKKVSGRETRDLNPVEVDDSQILFRINAICQALLEKEGKLDVLANNEYTFAYSQKNCAKSAPTVKNVKVVLQDTGSAYIFKSVNNEAFGYSNVETANSGLMKDICQNRQSLTNPMVTATGAIWFSLTMDKDNCESESDAFCIQIDRGSLIEGNRYSIHTNDWMKVKVRGTNTGFFTDRKTVSSANCSEGETLEKRAILK